MQQYGQVHKYLQISYNYLIPDVTKEATWLPATMSHCESNVTASDRIQRAKLSTLIEAETRYN